MREIPPEPLVLPASSCYDGCDYDEEVLPMLSPAVVHRRALHRIPELDDQLPETTA